MEPLRKLTEDEWKVLAYYGIAGVKQPVDAVDVEHLKRIREQAAIECVDKLRTTREVLPWPKRETPPVEPEKASTFTVPGPFTTTTHAPVEPLKARDSDNVVMDSTKK